MSSANRSTTLSEDIAEILATRAQAAGTASTQELANLAAPGLAVRKSIAVGSMMMLAINPAPVGAVGLGEIHVQSRLFQVGSGYLMKKNSGVFSSTQIRFA